MGGHWSIDLIPEDATKEDPKIYPSCDPPQSAKTAQAKEIASLKKRVKKLKQRKKSRTSRVKRLRKVGLASRVESSNDVSLGTQEDASNQGSKIADLDADAEVTLIDETQERFDEEMLFDIKAGKPKAVTIAATKITTAVASTRPKAKGIVFHDQEKKTSAFTPIVSSLQSSQLPQIKDKGKGKMVESENPFKKKDQVALDEELALRLQAKEQAELEKKKLHKKKLTEQQLLKNWLAFKL
ncbi:hypothetical protein Tco_0865131 [Tanacetum coccineum]